MRAVHLQADPGNDRAVSLLAQTRAELADEGRLEVVEDPRRADVAVIAGGDGHLLRSVHQLWEAGVARPVVYGLNCGTVGFLLNRPRRDDGTVGLADRLAEAVGHLAAPLRVDVTHLDGRHSVCWAINDVSLLRAGPQAAHLQVAVDDVVRIERLVGDGLVVATAAGSAAYNRSAGGPILPLGSQAISMVPLAPYRPRGWSGAVLPRAATVQVQVLDTDKRPVVVTADHRSVHDAARLELSTGEHDQALTVLHDRGWELEDRLLAEQFPG